MQPDLKPATSGQDRPGARPGTRLGGREAWLFSLRAAVAGTVAFICYRWTQLPGASWAAISAVLVMEPTLRPSLRLSLIRFAGNAVGALCGAAGSLTLGPTPLAILLGLLATGVLCHYTLLDDGRRPACAAMLIVLTNSDSPGGALHSTGERLAAVMIGCTVALAVAFAFDLLLKKSRLAVSSEDTGE